MGDYLEATLPPTNEYWEACARHTGRTTTRRISSLFLCDACTEMLTIECFNGRPPIYHGFKDGFTFEGYCAFCAEKEQVTLRQWFVCPICENVVLAYPKGLVAAKMVHQFWADCVAGAFPGLGLEEQDKIRIEPFVVVRRKRETKAASLEALDFRATDTSTGEPLFLIELKAGPSPILGPGAMPEFQLDVNDYEDIVTVMRRTGLPAYVFHAQIVDDYNLPTRRTVGRGMWWTDAFSLRAALKKITPRRGEDKWAGYYRPEAFRPIEGFIKELAERGYEGLKARLEWEGIEDLPATE